jgi:hypothetical protein
MSIPGIRDTLQRQAVAEDHEEHIKPTPIAVTTTSSSSIIPIRANFDLTIAALTARSNSLASAVSRNSSGDAIVPLAQPDSDEIAVDHELPSVEAPLLPPRAEKEQEEAATHATEIVGEAEDADEIGWGIEGSIVNIEDEKGVEQDREIA